MRAAEFVMGVVMALFSVYLMWKSSELPIGWTEGSGPGGGAWPFWLSLIMLLSCIWILYNWWRRNSRPAKSDEPFFETRHLIAVSVVAILLTVTIALIHVVGVYVSIALFLAIYIGFLGRHGWGAAIGAALLAPVITFLFFEVALAITLPKGYTEPAFVPVYNRVYKCPRKKTWGTWAYCFVDPSAK